MRQGQRCRNGGAQHQRRCVPSRMELHHQATVPQSPKLKHLFCRVALDVRLDGFSNPVGALVRASNGALAFAYEPTYVRQPNAIPLSLSLPLSTEPFADIPTRSFFDNLLPERDSLLREVMANH